MFGHDSLPSRVYSYGAKAPIDGAETVDAQMELARRHRNALVRVDLKRRDKVEAAVLALSPALRKMEEEIAAAKASLKTARDIIEQASAQARKKTHPPGAAEAAALADKRLRELYKERKPLRQELFASPSWKPVGKKIDGRAKIQEKRLYAAVGRMGLAWGTRNFVRTTVKKSGPRPRFSFRDGGGHLVLQLQPKGGKGKGDSRVKGRPLRASEAFACKDSRLRIEPLPSPEPQDFIGPRLSKAARRRTRVWLRVGSEGKKPVWALVPVVLHRPIPEDAEIKFVHLVRWRIATHFEWRIQFVLSRASGWDQKDRASGGTVAIDVGWRVTGDDGKTPRPDGSMRVAYWKGSDGDEGELALPGDWLSEMRKTEDLRSIRDKELFNPMRDRLAQWIQKVSVVPQWLKDRTDNLPKWRSTARLAAVAMHWRVNRFDGDQAIFAELEAWRKRDKHLLEYECNLRDQLQNRRLDIFRNFSAKMRRKYRTAKVEKLDLRDFHKLPEAEEGPVDGALKEHVRDACLSSLTDCLRHSMGEIVKVPAQYTTAKCKVCGSVQKWNRKILRHRCTACGAEWDQDENAATNIGGSAASAEVVTAR